MLLREVLAVELGEVGHDREDVLLRNEPALLPDSGTRILLVDGVDNPLQLYTLNISVVVERLDTGLNAIGALLKFVRPPKPATVIVDPSNPRTDAPAPAEPVVPASPVKATVALTAPTTNDLNSERRT